MTDINTLTLVNYAAAKACIIQALRANSVPYLQGSPGVGKSEIYAEIVKEFKLYLIDLRLGQMEPTDLMGFPMLNADSGKAGYAPMNIFPLEGDPIPEGYVGFLLLLDEINAAERATIKAAYKLVLDRMVGPFKLHPKCFVAMAGNLDTDGALTEEMGTAMQSRIAPHIQLEVNPKQWLQWANDKGIDHRICAFIEFRPDLLHDFRADHIDNTYPCPRTWEKLHNFIHGKDLDTDLKDIALPLVAGTIGSGATIELLAFIKLYGELPKLSEILANPENVEFSDKGDVQYALTGMLAEFSSESNIEKLLVFINRLTADFQALTIRTIRQRKNALKHHSVITDWIEENASLLID